jgi:hypothetical protein
MNTVTSGFDHHGVPTAAVASLRSTCGSSDHRDSCRGPSARFRRHHQPLKRGQRARPQSDPHHPIPSRFRPAAKHRKARPRPPLPSLPSASGSFLVPATAPQMHFCRTLCLLHGLLPRVASRDLHRVARPGRGRKPLAPHLGGNARAGAIFAELPDRSYMYLRAISAVRSLPLRSQRPQFIISTPVPVWELIWTGAVGWESFPASSDVFVGREGPRAGLASCQNATWPRGEVLSLCKVNSLPSCSRAENP